jgi:hypothetical protein
MRTQTFHLGHPGHLEDFFFRVGVLLEASIALQDFEGALIFFQNVEESCMFHLLEQNLTNSPVIKKGFLYAYHFQNLQFIN